MSWKTLSESSPELAEFGRQRFATEVAYLATVKADGAPRVHPVTPIVAEDHLFVFMEPTSPKGHDLQRDGRYALHASVSDSSGGAGEFLVSGRGRRVDDPELRALAAGRASYEPADRYVLYELRIERALATEYTPQGQPKRRRWRAGHG